MRLFLSFCAFLGLVAAILWFFTIIITSSNYEWPAVILGMLIALPLFTRLMYRLILEHIQLDFLYGGHDITAEEVQPWKKISFRLKVGLIVFGILALTAWTGFFLLGGPALNEVVYRGGKRVEVMKDIWKIVSSYSCYLLGILLTSLVFAYVGILLRGWYFSTHANSRFVNTIQALKNFFFKLFGKITGIEINSQKE